MTSQCAVCGVFLSQPFSLGAEPACELCFEAAVQREMRSRWEESEPKGQREREFTREVQGEWK